MDALTVHTRIINMKSFTQKYFISNLTIKHPTQWGILNTEYYKEVMLVQNQGGIQNANNSKY